MSDLSATDREILRMVFGRAKVRIARAMICNDHVEIDRALDTIEDAIEGHQAGRARPQQGATKEQIAHREAKYLHVVKGE